MSVKSWLEKNEVVLKALAACIVSITAASWAVIGLVYADFIKPLMLPPHIDTEITERQVGKTDKYTVHEISFKFTNVGINRVFIPGSYFLANAYRVIHSRDDKNDKNDKNDKEADIAIRNYLSTLSQNEILALKTQALNYVFVRKWQELLSKDNLSGQLDLRAAYGFDPDSFIYVQIGRLTGLNEMLDPGDATTSQILMYVPLGFQAIEIINRTLLSKSGDIFAKYQFVGIPTHDKKGLLMIAIDNSKPLPPQMLNLSETIRKQMNNKFYSTAEENLKKAEVIEEEKRMQFYISEDVQSSTKTAIDSVSGNIP